MDDGLVRVLMVSLFVLGACLAFLVPVQNSKKRKESQFSEAAQNAPFSIWLEDEGKVIWQNRFCTEYFEGGAEPFCGMAEFEPSKDYSAENDMTIFVLKELRPKTVECYSIFSAPLAEQTVYYAQDATALVETENELQRFLQTLASTFAHLPIGLAVFDKKRDLTLFNPALSSLLGLAPDWLARRPTMRSFLDRLRNEGAIPEPKDFAKLRHEFAELESGSFTGTYEVDWALPTGQIYRVTGRPHLQGGAALLFEDVSRAAALEMKYRAEIKLLYSALEGQPDAIAIFDQAGELYYANDVFDRLWDCSFSTSITPTTATDVSRLFQKKCNPTPVWGEFRNFIHDLNERSQWQAIISHREEGDFDFIVSPVADGNVMCQFRPKAAFDEPAQLAG